MIRLLLGPLRSGKSTRIRNAVRGHLRNREQFRLLVPTATMAEQLRRDFAEEGFLVRRESVQTLAEFLGRTEELVPPAALRYFLRKALERQRPAIFQDLLQAPGLLEVLARAQEELYNGGCDALRLAGLVQMGVLRGPEWPAFASLVEESEAECTRRGLTFRAARVLDAARRIRKQGAPGIERLYVDGFFSHNLPERELFRALSGWVELTMTLPEWPGAQATLDWLRRTGVETERCNYAPNPPAITKVFAPLLAGEAEEIARRIWMEAENGRPLRDILVILRSAEPYVPLIRSTFARFGIPARFYFPGRLTAELRATGTPGYEGLETWQSRAARIRAWQTVLEEAGRFLDPPPATFEELSQRAPEFLAEAAVRWPSPGENSVAVVDAFEARQWERPLVFVCGLIEGSFPKYAGSEALLTADVRQSLVDAGVPVDTMPDRARTEESLFDVAVTRGTERVILTWHAFDGMGDPRLPALAMDRLDGDTESALAVQVKPGRDPEPLAFPIIDNPLLQERLMAVNGELHATSVDTYLQCPFQFFGRYSLGLRNAKREEELLSPAKQGWLMHKVLEAWHLNREQPLEAIFEERWNAFVKKESIPDGYRAEVARTQLLGSVRAIAVNEEFLPGWQVQVEQPFRLELDRVRVRGRIDRLDVSEDRQCRVFEYKYTSQGGIKKRRDRLEEGTSVQGGLYLLGVESLGYRPKELRLVAVRGEVNSISWTNPVELRSLAAQARAQVLMVAQRLTEGEIRAKPAEVSLCRYCELRDACRVGSTTLAEADEAAAT